MLIPGLFVGLICKHFLGLHIYILYLGHHEYGPVEITFQCMHLDNCAFPAHIIDPPQISE